MTPAATAGAVLPRVYLCGPIAEGAEAARGGFQACNRRTIGALRALGIDVVPLAYPHPRVGGLRKFAQYLVGFLQLYGQLLACRRGSIVHITAVAANFIYNEWPLVWLARLAGCRVIFDVRAGAARQFYDEWSGWFRFVFRGTLRSAHVVMVEGEVFADFIESITGRAPVHLPNHLDTGSIDPRALDERLPASPTLAYVGRIVPEKGVESVLQACRWLHAAGLRASVKMIGEGEPDYLERLRRDFADVGAQWLGPQSPDVVLAQLKQAHFFVFPTRHRGEGQSNALTEAMACGCVPVASKHGFNEAVIGDAGVTLPADSPPSAYADAVLGLWRSGSWRRHSRLAALRVRERFSTPAVMRTLVEQYRQLRPLA